MTRQLSALQSQNELEWHISGSKSESNRLLILQAFYPQIKITNLSNSNDTQVLKKALQNSSNIVDVGHAGTAMRFLTAYFASQATAEVFLTGSQRMQERPIKILVEALRNLGAKIEYAKQEGFPPLLIKPAVLTKSQVSLPANISSQYISALLLIAPRQKNGLQIGLTQTVTSLPYIEMTLNLLRQLGAKINFQNNTISVDYLKEPIKNNFQVEPDWSSASYFYSLAALSKTASISLPGFSKNSLQGDVQVAEIYKQLGVKTSFTETGIRLKKQTANNYSKNLELDLSNTPDLAQTIVVTCLGLNISCNLKGLHTLKIKETDRLQALKTELEKFGAKVKITSDSLQLLPAEKLVENVQVETYQDHRMAMAFAPLAVKIPLSIKNPEVVKKSFPDFWKALAAAGIR